MQGSIQENILTVTQLTNAIKGCLEPAFPNIWLKGEVSNFKMQQSGHLYFSLKDANAQIAAVMFRGDAMNMTSPLPKDGTEVLARGELNIYPLSGRYQIIVRELRPTGAGELLLRLEELKKAIAKKGWFRPEHKKPIPKFPKKIGVVTSPTGAVIQDILHILSRRFYGFHLILNPVKVQGEGAAAEIAQAIRDFNDHHLVDVMIVGRGGGSIEDLWAFNEEKVAEAIFNSKIPIICAVGHETDHCIAEYVADVRAPTPSAAAELVVCEQAQLQAALADYQRKAQQNLRHLIKVNRRRLEGIVRQPVIASPYGILGKWMQKLDNLKTDLEFTLKNNFDRKNLLLNARARQLHSLRPIAQIQQQRQKLAYFDRSIQHAWKRLTLNKKERLDSLFASLRAINPKSLLTRGYSILFSENDKSVITSSYALKKKQTIRILLADGEALSTINDIFPYE